MISIVDLKARCKANNIKGYSVINKKNKAEWERKCNGKKKPTTTKKPKKPTKKPKKPTNGARLTILRVTSKNKTEWELKCNTKKSEKKPTTTNKKKPTTIKKPKPNVGKIPSRKTSIKAKHTVKKKGGIFVNERSGKQIIKDVKWIRANGVKSDMAIATIMAASMSSSIDVSVKEATERFMSEVADIEVIHKKAMELFKNAVEQDVYFAYRTLVYIQFGTVDPKNMIIEEPTCPYDKEGVNFMISLLASEKCQCLCYTQYVISMSEQLGHTNVQECLMSGHINIVVTDPDSFKKINITTNRKYKGDDDTTRVSKQLVAVFDSGFRNNVKTRVITNDTSFREKYTKGVNLANVKIILRTSQIMSCRTVPNKSTDDPIFVSSRWQRVVSIIVMLNRRRRHLLGETINVVNAIYNTDMFNYLNDPYLTASKLHVLDKLFPKDKPDQYETKRICETSVHKMR